MPLDPKTALDALRKVMDPELRRDLVSLGMVKDLAVDGDTVRLKVELTTPACPLKDTIATRREGGARGRRVRAGRAVLGRAGARARRARRRASSRRA